MGYNSNKHGRAEYNQHMQVSPESLSGIVSDEGSDNISFNNETRYAQLVYQVNQLPINLNGEVVVDAVGIDGSGDVGLTDDALNVSEKGFSTFFRTSGNYYFHAEAVPGTLVTSAGWRIKRIYDDGNSIDVMWADGNTNFDNIASDYASLTYSY